MPPELFTLIGGTVMGFVFKMMAQQAQDRAEQHKMFIEALKATTDSQNAAVQRVPNDKAGNWVRRVIIIAILFGVILAPFMLAMLGKPIIVEVNEPVKTWLFGLWSTGGKPKFYQLGSYLLVPEVRQALMAIIGFYFGTASAKR